MTVDRATLFEEVWKEPMTKVAERYDVSSNYLARVCARMNVPRPPRGYWAKLRHGVKVEQPSLPKARARDLLEWGPGHSLPLARSRPQVPQSVKPGPKRGKSDPRPTVHPLVTDTREHFERHYPTYGDDYLRPRKRNVVDLLVTKKTLQRAVEIASGLFLALEDDGCRVELAPLHHGFQHIEANQCENGERSELTRHPWSPGRSTIAWVGDLAVGLTVFEICENVEVRYGYSGYTRPTPCGRLGVHAYAPYPGVEWDEYWRESKHGELPSMFTTIAKKLIKAAPQIRKLAKQAELAAEEQERRAAEQRAVREREYAEQRKRWAREAEERRKQERREQIEKDVVDKVEKWRLAQEVRAYVAEVNRVIQEAGMQVVEGGPAEEELKGALEYADRIDPFVALHEVIARTKAEHAQECAECGTPGADDETGNGGRERTPSPVDVAFDS